MFDFLDCFDCMHTVVNLIGTICLWMLLAIEFIFRVFTYCMSRYCWLVTWQIMTNFGISYIVCSKDRIFPGFCYQLRDKSLKELFGCLTSTGRMFGHLTYLFVSEDEEGMELALEEV